MVNDFFSIYYVLAAINTQWCFDAWTASVHWDVRDSSNLLIWVQLQISIPGYAYIVIFKCTNTLVSYSYLLFFIWDSLFISLCHPFHTSFCIRNWRGTESTHFHWTEAILLNLCCSRIQFLTILIWSDRLLILSLLITQCSSSYRLLCRSDGNISIIRATWFMRRFYLVYCKVFSARFSFLVSCQQASHSYSHRLMLLWV